MAIKPMLFNTEMVQAILEGRKTVTRRVVKFKAGWNPKFTGYMPDRDVLYGSNNIPAVKAPYKAGDVLWVRETWSPVNVRPRRYIYKADVDRRIGEGVGLPLCWHPSIHMPKEAARIFLRVTDVRVERLRDMSVDDVFKEGVFVKSTFEHIWDRWRLTWDDTIKPTDRPTYGWEANPWTWVIEFERCEKPEGWPCWGHYRK